MTEYRTLSEHATDTDGGYAPRSHAHEARILQIAARGMNVNVGSEEAEYWSVGAKAAAALDTLVDEEGCRDITPFIDVVMGDQPQGIEGVLTDEEAQKLAGFFRNLSPARQEAWLNSATELPLYADMKASAPTIGKLVDVTLAEAETAFAGAFRLDTVGYDDEMEREKFNRWLTHFARAGYAIDASLDMPKDYANKVIRVEPTLRNRTEMLLAARADMPKCFGVGRVALVEFARTGWATVKERKR